MHDVSSVARPQHSAKAGSTGFFTLLLVSLVSLFILEVCETMKPCDILQLLDGNSIFKRGLVMQSFLSASSRMVLGVCVQEDLLQDYGSGAMSLVSVCSVVRMHLLQQQPCPLTVCCVCSSC